MTAIEELFDLLGPARGTAADPAQEWDDTLRLSAISAALKHIRLASGEEQGIPGVLDVTIIDPPANVTPTDHAPPGVPDFLVPGIIAARPA